jgi:hypothetical protein
MKTLIKTLPKATAAKTCVLCALASGLVWFSATAVQTFASLKRFSNLAKLRTAPPPK